MESELNSLGVKPKPKKEEKEPNDKEELAALADNIKQVYFQDYKSAYSEDQKIDQSHFDYII